MEQTSLLSIFPESYHEAVINEISEVLEKRKSGKSLLARIPDHLREDLITEVSGMIEKGDLKNNGLREPENIDNEIRDWANKAKSPASQKTAEDLIQDWSSQKNKALNITK